MNKLQIGSFSKCLIAAILFHRREGFGDLSDCIPEAVKLILLWGSYSERTFTPPALSASIPERSAGNLDYGLTTNTFEDVSSTMLLECQTDVPDGFNFINQFDSDKVC